MKTKIYLYGLAIGVSTLITASCKKDFLNQLPESTASTAQVYKTPSDFYTAVVGAYSTLKSNGVYGVGNALSSMLHLGETLSDNSDYGSAKNVNILDIFELEEFNFSLTNKYFTNPWLDHYAGIGRVNTILAKMAPIEFTPALKTRFEAESKFLRALFYFNLVRLYGDVPLITTEFATVEDAYKGNSVKRAPTAEVYALIISDLTFAENNLPDVIPAGEAGRASKWAAKALLGRVYLTNKDYPKASAKLNEVILSGLFNLSNSYAAVFTNTTAFTANKDVIFAVQYLGGLIGQGNAITTSTVPAGITTGLFGITGGGVGEGFLRPTAEMVTEYEANDLRKLASVATTYLNAANATVNERHVVKYKQTGSVLNDSDIDLPILRYADVLLMYAEALHEQGQTAVAFAPSATNGPINLVRKRAGLADLAIPVTPALGRLDIEHERRVELAFEGHRWFDLLRTDRYLTVMTSKGYATKAFHKLLPIPFRETGINKDLGQNKDY